MRLTYSLEYEYERVSVAAMSRLLKGYGQR